MTRAEPSAVLGAFVQNLASTVTVRSMHDVRPARAHLWLDGTGDWAWPGSGGEAAAELLPPPWVPALPHRAQARDATAFPGARPPQRALRRRYGTSLLLAALAAVCVGLALDGRANFERLVGVRAATGQSAAALSLARSVAVSPQPSPTVAPVSRDAAGSSIDSSSYPSQALHGEGSFLIYLPPGYASTATRYPVIYLLHGEDQTDSSFLQMGVQGTLDRLIARHAIPPTIAVMIQGGPGTNNWRNHGAAGYESYVLEVQRLIDRTLPTIPERNARAIVGYSMGGYGAMHLALTHPQTFSAVESWLGFFDGLEGRLRADRSTIARLGLRAYVYGGASDYIADPSENAPFAAALRAAGADAHSAVYPGEHDFETLEAHLEHMLAFAGRGLSGER
ncbi:MAG TPA: alpha/beta hydrolase-fold protein [Solirubrobacteraceae bacterium]|jgi:enterochelin esterase-like enzyme|nr:alpha/beta hydrolase-fold protein [Solirubrobacteraceae bacterium]